MLRPAFITLLRLGVCLVLVTGTASAQTTAAIPSTGAADPVLRILPRPGDFFGSPTGPGVYSLVDEARGVTRSAPPRSGYPAFAIMTPSFFDADFRYLDATPMADRAWFERLKRVRSGDWLWSTGGAAWFRLHDEHNSRLTRTDQTYSLPSVRAYVDGAYGDRVRLYGEVVSAARWGGSLPVLPIESDHVDLQNGFADIRVATVADHPIEVRVGRQEMLLGSQRLVSPLPWGNVRRSFDGVRVFRQGARVDVDGFVLDLVTPNRTGFDKTNTHAQFAGAWLTFRQKPGRFVDLYALYSNNSSATTQLGVPISPARTATIGGRSAGDRNNLLWDVEGAIQTGSHTAADSALAGMASAGIGRRVSAKTSPTVWFYYDWASGDSDPSSGRSTTFNQLYPFGHYYLGWLDLAGRQNVRDANVHAILYPRPWITLWLQYHHLWLDAAADALYNTGGNATRRDPTGAAGTRVGGDADVIVNLHIDAQSDVMIALAQSQAGQFLTGTSSATRAPSGRVLSLIYDFRW
jgi:hypothetical protein